MTSLSCTGLQYLEAVSSLLRRIQHSLKNNSGKRKKKKDGLKRDRKQLLVDVYHPHSAYKVPKGSGTGVEKTHRKIELVI